VRLLDSQREHPFVRLCRKVEAHRLLFANEQR
jgi:hypothetical protein